MSSKNKDKKKLKVPSSVLQLGWSPKKFAKENNIRLKGKGMKRKDKHRAQKRLNAAYAKSMIDRLNKAVKILSEYSHLENKKINKIRKAIDNVLMNTAVMKRIAKLYKKDPKRYPDMSFLPLMIMTMIQYYSQPDLNDDEKEIADKFDIDALTVFCENILKKEIRSYARQGLTKTVAFQMAAVIPTAKILKGRGGRWWYKRIVDTMYRIAEDEPVDVQAVLTAIRKVDKKKIITSAELRLGFYSEFLMTRSSNKVAKYNNDQKELYDTLISQTLEYLNDMKASKLREVLRAYIKRRKYAEEHKNDSKRVIKFVDHANSNSPYSTIKSVVQDLISDNSNNELYLS